MTSRSEVAESALCAAETTPYRTMNLYPDALFICRQGRIVFANAACMRLLGANCPEQILGRSPLDFVHRDHKPRVEQRIVERMATGSPSPLIEEKLVRVDGETVDVEVAVLPYQAQDQTVLHVLLRDVAMRKEAERELKDSEEQFRNLFEESPLGLCMISLDLHIRRANARLGTMLGYSGREMVDRTIDTFVHPEDVPAGIECLRCLIYGEIPRCTFEMRFLTRSEQIVWGRLHVSMVRDSKQASRYALAMIEDITERKHAEQTQCEEHQRFENMVATSPGALYSLRLRPDGTSSLPYVSPRLSELYGLQSEPVQEDASALFALIHPDDLPEVQAAIAASAQTMDPCRNEHRILHPKMGMRWIEIYSMPEREADGSVQWHGIAVDITDRKQGEEILRKNQEHLRIAIDAAKLGLWECDLKTEKLIWSGHCEKLFGMLPGEFDGTYQTFLQRIHPDDRSDLVASRENARKTGAAYAHVYRVVWPDGTIHWLSGVGHFLYDDTGEATHAAGAMIDVTERQRLQEERVQMLAVAERRAVTLAMARRVALDILVNRTGTEALKHIAEAARTLAQARYAALGVADSTGERLQDFITAGLTSEEESAIGTLPDGRGVLGLLLTSAEPLRIDTLAEHPASVGFPPAHPLMESFLGVPIRSDDRVLGSLYLTNGAGGAPFTDADEAAIAALADYAAVAIHFQHLLHQQSLLTHSFINTLEEERRSVSYELHDGLTQYV
ncbi:MAG: multi-sensor hybrid histidine kinase, partial [Chthonomonadaceae bacterium]|nr:multi-sensor hybrid histidine kinase [Chthonomonadaceae bacterium]